MIILFVPEPLLVLGVVSISGNLYVAGLCAVALSVPVGEAVERLFVWKTHLIRGDEKPHSRAWSCPAIVF